MWLMLYVINHDYCKVEDDDCSLEPPSKVARIEPVSQEETGGYGEEGETPTVSHSATSDHSGSATTEHGELFVELMCLFSEASARETNHRGQAFSDTIRRFSITMFTYSPKAYRSIFTAINSV